MPVQLDVVALLVRQHRDLEGRLTAVATAQDAEKQHAQLHAWLAAFATHLVAEEEVFYAAVRAERTDDILLDSLQEHVTHKRLIAALWMLQPDDADRSAKCDELLRQTAAHPLEEEHHLFPQVRQLMSSTRREALGQQLLLHEAQLNSTGPAHLLQAYWNGSVLPGAPPGRTV